jgi:IS30 family transposase
MERDRGKPNSRPRKTLNFDTPADRLAAALFC